MKFILCVPLALACICLSMHAPAAELDKAEAQTIVYLGDRWPVVIRVHLHIDGEPHREAWKDFMDEMFDYLDVNKSGKLGKKEAAGAPPPGVLVSQGFGGGGNVAAEMDADRDGVVTRAEFRAYYRKNGLAPFTISANGRRNSDFIRIVDVDGGLGGGKPSSEALNARLFALLDANKDGTLSKDELAAAPKILGKLDKDEDEMVTPAEVMGQQRGNDFNGTLFLTANGDVGQGESRFVMLAEGKTDRAMGRRLLERYAAKGKKKVEAKTLGLGKLDRDEDGWLDAEELSRIGEIKPDLELVVRVGKRAKGEAFVEVVRRGKALAKVETTKEGVSLTIDNARLDLRGPEPVEKMDFNVDALGQYKSAFKAADTDNNGYLDKQEAERSPLFRSLFAVMDRDGDGQLFEKEMLAYLKQMDKFRALVRKGCASLIVRDEGKGLFDLIDADSDGRLSVRELRNAAKVLMKLDQDGDAKVSPDEVPRHFRGSFEQGAAGVRPTSLAIAVSLNGEAPPPPPARTKGPLWFRKMDRNRDEDVSRAEWLGSDEAFAEIDADGDGLLSAAEAEAYDRKKRK